MIQFGVKPTVAKSLALISLSLACLSTSIAASFDCTKVKAPVHKAICSIPELSALDDQLDVAYRAAQISAVSLNQLAADEQTWIAQVRNKCQDANCLAAAYRNRIDELSAGENGLPGFSKDESYESVRRKMLANGWQPYHDANADVCAGGDTRCQGRPEMQACAGTGMANCRFLWQKDGKTVVIFTVGEVEAVFDGIRQVDAAGNSTSAPVLSPESDAVLKSIKQVEAASASTAVPVPSPDGVGASRAAPAPIPGDASSSGTFGIGAILMASLGGVVLAILAFLVYRRFQKLPSAELTQRQASDVTTDIDAKHDLRTSVGVKSEAFETLEIDLPSASPRAPRAEHSKVDASVASRTLASEGLSRTVKYGGGFLIAVVAFGIIGNFWVRTTRPLENETQTMPTTPAAASNSLGSESSNESMLVDQLVADIKAHPADRDFIASGPGYEFRPGINVYYSTDRFHENPGCQFEFDGKGAPASKGVRKWRLTYFKSKDRELIKTGIFFENTPIRVFVESGSNYLETDEHGYLQLTSKNVERLMSAKQLKLQHGFSGPDEVSWTYDISMLGLIRKVALRLCP